MANQGGISACLRPTIAADVPSHWGPPRASGSTAEVVSSAPSAVLKSALSCQPSRQETKLRPGSTLITMVNPRKPDGTLLSASELFAALQEGMEADRRGAEAVHEGQGQAGDDADSS